MLDFETLVNIYEMKLENIRRRWKRGFITEEQMKSEWTAIHFLFEDIKAFMDNCFKQYQEEDFIPEKLEELREHYKYEGEVPYTFYVYRGHIIPIYSDDYGQQDYTVINGQVCGGGAYNFNAIYDFCSILDYRIEKEFMESDPQIEWPEWSKSEINIKDYLK